MGSNKYPGFCSRCGTRVDAYEGTIIKSASGSWVPAHEKYGCPGESHPAAFSLPATDCVDVKGTNSAQLFAHQAQLVAAVQAGARSILLADEPGLGKTASALISAAAAGSKRVLVVVPATVKINWAREVELWLPGTEVLVLAGRKAAAIAGDARVVIVNFDVVASWAGALISWRPDALLVDEGHYVKDSRSGRGRAVLDISKAMPSTALRMLLTGTPIPNAPIDLSNQLNILNLLDSFGGWWAYAERYCGSRHEGFKGADKLDELHEKLLAAGMVRRRKSEVVGLPSRTVVDVPVDLNAEGARSVKQAQAALVEKLIGLVHEEEATRGHRLDNAGVERVVRRELGSSGAAFDELAKLRQVVGLAKVSLVVAQAKDILESGEQVVVMLHHRAVQEAVADALSDFGAMRITGGQSMEQRQAGIDNFQAGGARVAVCSIQAAGVGITLTGASQVILGELPWTSAAQEQAIDRVHRIGQDAPVTAWRLLANGTLDDRLAAVIASKAGIALAAIDGGEVAEGESTISTAEVLTELVLVKLKPGRRVAKLAA